MDHHFPKFHVRPSTGYVNDPNGPVYVNGRWHLYFQYVFDTPRTGPVYWGHASSDDLARWRLHPPAISPGSGDGVDRDGCWSGNTVGHDGGLLAFYSGFRRGHPYESVVVAESADGETFSGSRLVVADPDPSENVKQFRDPFVWRDGDSWSMVVGAESRAGEASVRLYQSADLDTWTYRGPLAGSPRITREDLDTGTMWECPQLFSFGDREALLVAAQRPERIGDVVAVTGVRDGAGLRDPQLSRVDVGPNFYAPSALRESPAGPLLWGWVTEGRSREWAIEADWSGVVSLPRSVNLTEDGRLASRPPESLLGLRDELIKPEQGADRTRAEIPELGPQFEVDLELDRRGSDDTQPTTVTLQAGPSEQLVIAVDWSSGRLRLDRDRASLDPRAERGVCSFDEPTLRSADRTRLRWYVDGSVVELFTESGQCATLRFYPTTPPPWRLAVAGLSTADLLEVWSIRPFQA